MVRRSKPRKQPSGSTMRIVGGRFRGRQLQYDGDVRTRPMKDRTREAIFNLLGPAVKGTQVWDLFGGTGAMALEAISRGAVAATVIERRFPAARTISANVSHLGLSDCVTVVTADAFTWWPTSAPSCERPWVTFCCPPYALYAEREADLLTLVQNVIDQAPAGSLTVLEFDKQFDATKLPRAEAWDLRRYPPATVAILDSVTP